MAILLGIYDKLIGAISNFHKSIKANALYLGKFTAAVGLGIGSLAFVLKWLLETFTIPVSAFFVGAVFGGIPALYQKTKIKPFSIASVLYFLLGFGVVLATSYLPAGNMDLGGGIGIGNIFMIFITGLVIAIALILPGISTSHMLLVLGMYDDLLGAITNFNITFLAVISIATAVGVFLITKPIEWTLRNYPHQTYYAIIGFVVGSISAIIRGLVLPAIPEVISLEWWAMMAPIAIVTFAMGYWAILSLSKFSNE